MLGSEKPVTSASLVWTRNAKEAANERPLASCAHQPVGKDCRKDAQNCQYFALFSSKEKRLHTIFKDKIEANFEGTAEDRPLLFLTLTFNTTREDLASFTTN